MDRKREIKKDIWDILRTVYVINEEKGITDKQQLFLDKIVDYLDSEISLRRKVKEKEPEKAVKKVIKHADHNRFDL